MSDLLPKQTKPEKVVPKSVKTPSTQDGSKRRGPNSHRVRNLFDSITEQRIPLDDAIKLHNVSVHVARQSKRFDPFMDRGQVVIKTLSDDSGAKQTFIWRVPTGTALPQD